MFYEETKLHLFKKNTEKVVLLLVKESLDANSCQVQGCKNFVPIFIMHQTSYLGARNIVHKNDCAHLKMKSSFQDQIPDTKCVPEFSIFSALKLASCGMMVFTDMNTYILTEGRNFKSFLQKKYAIASDSCYLFTKENVEHGIEHDIDNTYGVLIH